MLRDNLLYSGPNHHSMETAIWLNPFWLWRSHGSLGRSPVVQWDGILVQCPSFGLDFRDGLLGSSWSGSALAEEFGGCHKPPQKLGNTVISVLCLPLGSQPASFRHCRKKLNACAGVPRILTSQSLLVSRGKKNLFSQSLKTYSFCRSQGYLSKYIKPITLVLKPERPSHVHSFTTRFAEFSDNSRQTHSKEKRDDRTSMWSSCGKISKNLVLCAWIHRVNVNYPLTFLDLSSLTSLTVIYQKVSKRFRA